MKAPWKSHGYTTDAIDLPMKARCFHGRPMEVPTEVPWKSHGSTNDFPMEPWKHCASMEVPWGHHGTTMEIPMETVHCASMCYRGPMEAPWKPPWKHRASVLPTETPRKHHRSSHGNVPWNSPWKHRVSMDVPWEHHGSPHGSTDVAMGAPWKHHGSTMEVSMEALLPWESYVPMEALDFHSSHGSPHGSTMLPSSP